MKFVLTKYGWPQVVVLPAILSAAVVAFLLTPLPKWIVVPVVLVLTAILVWTLSFFRDPDRSVPEDEKLLLAPADGRITDIELIAGDEFIDAPTVRIGIFLSIFDVHINRAPCKVRVEKITYKKGKYKDARNPRAGRLNESNDLALVRTAQPQHRLKVRQISGAIARRIVCNTKEGCELAGGEKFGMIKFGSRTELYLPADKNAKFLVNPGDKVKAGLTPLVKYE